MSAYGLKSAFTGSESPLSESGAWDTTHDMTGSGMKVSLGSTWVLTANAAQKTGTFVETLNTLGIQASAAYASEVLNMHQRVKVGADLTAYNGVDTFGQPHAAVWIVGDAGGGDSGGYGAFIVDVNLDGTLFEVQLQFIQFSGMNGNLGAFSLGGVSTAFCEVELYGEEVILYVNGVERIRATHGTYRFASAYGGITVSMDTVSAFKKAQADNFYLGTLADITSDRYICRPWQKSGINVGSGAEAAWINSAWVQLMVSHPFDTALTRLVFMMNSTDADILVNVTEEWEIAVGTGVAGSEVEKVVIPGSWRMDVSKANHYFMTQTITLPEPFFIPAGTRVAVRVRQATANAPSISGVKGLFKEIAPSLDASIAGADINGASTESGARSATIPATDINGASTEATLLNQTKAGADADGPGAELITLTAILAGADADGAGAEVGVVDQQKAGAEATGGTTEAGSPSTALFSGDVNSGMAEDGVVGAPKAGADASGTAADLAALIAGIAGADQFGTLIENAVAIVTPAGTDQNSVIVESAFYQMDVTAADQRGVVTELAALLASFASADAGSTTETATYRYALVISDVAAAADAAVVTIVITTNDLGQTTEIAVLTAMLTPSDTGLGSDLAGVLVSLAGTDANGVSAEIVGLGFSSSDAGGPSIETGIVVPTTSSGDSASAVDAAITSASLLVQQAAAAIDSGTLLSAIQGADLSLSVLEVPRIGVYGVDLGGITEDGATVINITANDEGYITELSELMQYFFAADQAQASEFALVIIASMLEAIATGRIVAYGADGEIADSHGGRILS